MRRGIRSLITVLLFVVLGIVIGVGLQGQAQLSLGQGPVVTATTQPAAPAGGTTGQQAGQPANTTVSATTLLMRDLYSRANPSVVSIRVRIPAGNRPIVGDNGQGGQFQMAAGSGFVFDNQGNIVTNAHVVQGADRVEVTFSDGNIMSATIKGIDLDSDLAVIQVQGDFSKYAALPLGDSDAVQVGDVVIAIGNPFEQAGTMTHGIISALNRTVQGLRTSGTGAFSIPGAIQTDAPLNPGNSGGPLINEFGQVIGVNEQIEAPAGQSSGISFAIPVNIVKKVAPALISNGKVDHPYVGISSTSLGLDLNQQLNLPANTRGALITSVSPNSPAAKAGLKAANVSQNSGTISGGDVIVAVDKQPVQSSDDLISYLFNKTNVGQTVTLTVLRGGQQQDVQVTLAARPTTSR
ncbi:MAG: trypsin-like peptidase domain-containing protein [Anaerolineae bacterium]|nr:trypsin-like peptidase domain-containing protein [Anaerolineae bacterium]